MNEAKAVFVEESGSITPEAMDAVLDHPSPEPGRISTQGTYKVSRISKGMVVKFGGMPWKVKRIMGTSIELSMPPGITKKDIT